MFYFDEKNIEKFLQGVADGAGMTVGVLKSSKCRRATDARYIAIMLLSELMTDDEMARLKRCDELLAELDPAVADNQRLSRLEAQLAKILEKLQGL